VAYPHDMNSYSQNPHALAPPWNISRKRWKVQVEDHSILGKFVIGHLTRNAGKTCYGCPVIPPLWRVTFVKGNLCEGQWRLFPGNLWGTADISDQFCFRIILEKDYLRFLRSILKSGLLQCMMNQW
jgi:hypothetical protein